MKNICVVLSVFLIFSGCSSNIYVKEAGKSGLLKYSSAKQAPIPIDVYFTVTDKKIVTYDTENAYYGFDGDMFYACDPGMVPAHYRTEIILCCCLIIGLIVLPSSHTPVAEQVYLSDDDRPAPEFEKIQSQLGSNYKLIDNTQKFASEKEFIEKSSKNEGYFAVIREYNIQNATLTAGSKTNSSTSSFTTYNYGKTYTTKTKYTTTSTWANPDYREYNITLPVVKIELYHSVSGKSPFKLVKYQQLFYTDQKLIMKKIKNDKSKNPVTEEYFIDPNNLTYYKKSRIKTISDVIRKYIQYSPNEPAHAPGV